ncbi:undecaprenyl-phosphate alpha-N-acetylglucosaminyl 1-phosphate transferase [candidate division KSB3 bacterium]|uniref:Undecaprenyl-phosphate alpha-N-acetylglucosaminyl 1-phosphate transferase n=1 Tax=candidate division KSB3 bacterium TaxID=2044937 RepID=A0A2G6E8C4_9BACT|nr:MAG: undecaprenyl-phosphate alpha-N-acetylglucosaminyl 1-phosphate transferase [candidate division KSB3 bacterium]PIE30482.1 MAG: undecaprenyl-phosphate alpha-N-acetylglucosaminyl 1-phosphate transferase [candidate division KSB3 bacterium]
MNNLIREYVFISGSAFLISVLFTPVIRKMCRKNSLLDLPTSPRKIHVYPVPRLGGVAIYLSLFLPLFAMLLIHDGAAGIFREHLQLLLSLFATSTLVFAVGVYDDIWGASVIQKLSVQLAAAAIAYCLGFRIETIAVPFIGPVELGILGIPLTILWIAGVTNAINFTDGIDGLACGVGFFSVSTMFILSLFLGHTLSAFFAAALAGGLFGFALYNFAPASIFMGDSGSLFIGFIIAAISLHSSQKSSTAVVLLIPVVALGVPITDTLLAIIRRVSQGLSPFAADREHIHHKLLNMGFSSRQVTLVLYGVCVLLGITALAMTAVNNQLLTLLLVFLCLMTIGGIKMLGYDADMIQINLLAKERIQQKRRILQRQKFAEEILADIEHAVDLLTLKKETIRFFENMDLDTASIVFTANPSFDVRWNSPRCNKEKVVTRQFWTISLSSGSHGPMHAGELTFGKCAESSSDFLESILLLEALKDTVERSLMKFSSEEDLADFECAPENSMTGIDR